MNKVLTRQLKKLGLTPTITPTQIEVWQELLTLVDNYYNESDSDRYRIERSMDISSTEMIELNNKLQNAQDKLIDTARRAGMSEVATSMLHNINNVLNSANTTAQWMKEELNDVIYERVTTITQLLSEHQPDLITYLEKDEIGKELPKYIILMHQRIAQSQVELKTEIDSLISHLTHISEITSAHKTINIAPGIKEKMRISRAIDAAIAICNIDLKANHILLEKNIIQDVIIKSDKHKIIQILINFIKNAIESLAACQASQQNKIIVTAQSKSTNDEKYLFLSVADNGIGIEAETHKQLFKFGFTTKKNGHGFGLHGSALTAHELQGKITVESKGHMQGAKFTLQILIPATVGAP